MDDFTSLSPFPFLSLLLVLPLSLVGQWWLLRRRWMTRVHEAQARHARYQARAEMLLSITRQRMNALQLQMTGRRADTRHPYGGEDGGDDEPVVILVDEDGAGRRLPRAEANAFVDTVADTWSPA